MSASIIARPDLVGLLNDWRPDGQTGDAGVRL